MGRRLGAELPLEAEVEVDVPFHDADPMGVTWHGNYFRYLESARSALLAKDRLQLCADDRLRYLLPIVEARIKYVKPTQFGQRLKVRATLEEYENRLKIAYVIIDVELGRARDDAYTTQVAVSRERRGDVLLLAAGASSTRSTHVSRLPDVARSASAAGRDVSISTDMGIVSPLGAGKAEVLARLLDGDQSGMVPSRRLADGSLDDRRAACGKRLQPLPRRSRSSTAATIACSRRALDQIAPVGRRAARRSSARIASPSSSGTSTSGIAAGEDAIEALAANGRLPAVVSLPASRRSGMAAEFAARYLGLSGPAIHDFDGVLVVGQSFRLGVAAARGGPLRRGDRRRRRQLVSRSR